MDTYLCIQYNYQFINTVLSDTKVCVMLYLERYVSVVAFPDINIKIRMHNGTKYVCCRL
jgi:hypothetical protein